MRSSTPDVPDRRHNLDGPLHDTGRHVRPCAWLLAGGQADAEHVQRALGLRYEIERFDDQTALLGALGGGGSPDVVILGDGNGLDLCRRLRELRDELALPVVLLSARRSAAEALAAGASDHLVEPFDPAELAARVGRLIRVRKLHERALAAGEPPPSLPGGPPTSRGSDVVEVKSSSQRDPLSQRDPPSGSRGAHDADLREQLERERRRADEASRLKEAFLATVSHELRTPLTAVLGWISMLRSSALTGAKRERALESIERNAQAEARLVEDLLDVSKLVSGDLRLEPRPIDLTPVVEAAIEAARPAAAAKGLDLLIDLDPAAGQVLGDADRLRQVAWNLLSNAVKFTPRGGRIEVRLARVGASNTTGGLRRGSPAVVPSGSIEISVTDTGNGIRADFLPHVFERFRQADSSTTRTYGGLGIGLSIARQLVELHGGTIHVHSEGEGRGATFAVRLPLHALPTSGPLPRVPARAAAVPELPELTGVRVLVVDDQADSRVLIASALELGQVEVQTAESAAEALELFRRRAPDLLLSDVGMPGEDGLSLIRAIRALPAEQGGRVPAVALTAYGGTGDRRQALGAGFDLHLAKPIDPAELLVVVASMTRRRATS
jgi:signal transduction histidine kinase